jgi:predicted MFS family arabinose efflux permease
VAGSRAPDKDSRAVTPLWRNRDYVLLWGGQSVSALGTQASQLALPLLVLALTGSPARAGLVGGLRGLAYVVFALPAGAVVDRWNRRRLMVLCDLARALAFASIPLAVIGGHLAAFQLYSVSAIEGALYAFFGLAETASLTRVVPPAQLPVAISQNQATEAGSLLIGPPLGGALFGVARALPFLTDAISYALSALSLLLIRTRLHDQRSADAGTSRAELMEGVRWIRRQPALVTLLWLNGGLNLVYGGWTLVLIELARRLGAGSGSVGLIFACGGAGTILGAALTPLLQKRFRAGRLIVTMAWIFALTWPPYALAPNLFILGAVNAIGFFFVPIGMGTELSYRLLLLPDALQGRVNSLFWLLGFGCQALGFVLIGLLLQRMGPVASVWITLVPAAGLALIATCSRSLRTIGKLAATAT